MLDSVGHPVVQITGPTAMCLVCQAPQAEDLKTAPEAYEAKQNSSRNA